jgi:hypothetical protein
LPVGSLPAAAMSGTYTTIDDPLGSGNMTETTEITGINDSGDIVGAYQNSGGLVNGFIATPSAPLGSPPTVTDQTATQTWRLGQTVNFSLPANTFNDPQAETMVYTATLANGVALPSWLHFNGSTDTFSGTVPNTATGLTIEVTATDTSGLLASETFAVSSVGIHPSAESPL